MARLTSLRRVYHISSPSFNKLPLSQRISTSYSRKETDSCGLPIQPTWSVYELLSSYPSPTLSTNTIVQLYELSALMCPKVDTPQFKFIKEELEDMVRLVEAVKLVDTSGISVKGRGEEEDSDLNTPHSDNLAESGKVLLKHASRAKDGFYIVDSDRRR
ncbi:hypothetical protein HYPSUDRAFT_38652 [Hypholoma sublateritium FD-334 SS-4]|uniref:Glutamyl-tRNA(Gln) amidotransferase subunit F, mitochondrial n=1 Tax=Hypholoma sublateritium (strain FD-334 SS-4) TaxID=945553 RepID=A0A0D2PZ09_HYPSF|nr:hypothetical protein HYPSUDRAFT_38652 [Hypholoma sublateritium FD-334 SS-4]